MEDLWVEKRIELGQLLRKEPQWTNRQYAQDLGMSLSWVKIWKPRLRGKVLSLESVQSRSHRPHNIKTKLNETTVNLVLSLRQQLSLEYNRKAGPKIIRYFLEQEKDISGNTLPKETTIWKILKNAGAIPSKFSGQHFAIPRPEPMQVWEIDFGFYQAAAGGERIEFLSVLDVGTSMLLDIHASHGFQAESALLAVFQTLLKQGRPQLIRLDRDPRFVGSWSNHDFVAAFLRFLFCLEIQVEICPPQRPDRKGFVERSIRTIKEECLFKERPRTLEAAQKCLETYREKYNHLRPNQALSCNNRPPAQAFPNLPTLPQLPQSIDPNAWLKHYHKKLFPRQVSSSGGIQIDKKAYYIGKTYTGLKVSILLDADERVFHVLLQGKIIKVLPLKELDEGQQPLQDFVKTMMALASTIERYRNRITLVA